MRADFQMDRFLLPGYTENCKFLTRNQKLNGTNLSILLQCSTQSNNPLWEPTSKRISIPCRATPRAYSIKVNSSSGVKAFYSWSKRPYTPSFHCQFWITTSKAQHFSTIAQCSISYVGIYSMNLSMFRLLH